MRLQLDLKYQLIPNGLYCQEYIYGVAEGQASVEINCNINRKKNSIVLLSSMRLNLSV